MRVGNRFNTASMAVLPDKFVLTRLATLQKTAHVNRFVETPQSLRFGIIGERQFPVVNMNDFRAGGTRRTRFMQELVANWSRYGTLYIDLGDKRDQIQTVFDEHVAKFRTVVNLSPEKKARYKLPGTSWKGLDEKLGRSAKMILNVQRRDWQLPQSPENQTPEIEDFMGQAQKTADALFELNSAVAQSLDYVLKTGSLFQSMIMARGENNTSRDISESFTITHSYKAVQEEARRDGPDNLQVGLDPHVDPTLWTVVPGGMPPGLFMVCCKKDNTYLYPIAPKRGQVAIQGGLLIHFMTHEKIRANIHGVYRSEQDVGRRESIAMQVLPGGKYNVFDTRSDYLPSINGGDVYLPGRHFGAFNPLNFSLQGFTLPSGIFDGLGIRFQPGAIVSFFFEQASKTSMQVGASQGHGIVGYRGLHDLSGAKRSQGEIIYPWVQQQTIKTVYDYFLQKYVNASFLRHNNTGAMAG